MPSEWKCSQCRTPPKLGLGAASVFACLECGELFCHGRDTREHAAKHHKRTSHRIFLDINEHQAFCFECAEYVVDNDASDRNIATIIESVEKVQSGDYVFEAGELTRLGGQPTPHSKLFQEKDRLDTAYGHYRAALAARVMHAWRVEAERKRPRLAVVSAAAAASTGPKKPIRMMLEATASKVGAPGKTGLRNLGNTCFINSVVQCLSNLAPLRDWLLHSFMDKSTPIRYNDSVTLWRRGTIDCLNAMSTNVAIDTKEVSLVVELHNIFRVLWSGKWLVVTPYALLDALWKFVPHFRGYKQQDAQEFYSFLLDRINTELTEAMKKNQKPLGPIPGSMSLSKSSASALAAGANKSLVGTLFEGQFSSEVTCTNCKNVSRRTEPFLDLELDLTVASVARRRTKTAPQATTLLACLERFAEPEEIEGYACDNCHQSCVASKRMVIHRLPKILTIVLKRFCYTAAGSLAKNDAIVSYPLDNLDLSGIGGPDAVKSDAQYDLKALIIHHGLSLRKGHYTSVCYNENLDAWYHFNDAKVTRVEDNQVPAFEAYMLMYSCVE